MMLVVRSCPGNRLILSVRSCSVDSDTPTPPVPVPSANGAPHAGMSEADAVNLLRSHRLPGSDILPFDSAASSSARLRHSRQSLDQVPPRHRGRVCLVPAALVRRGLLPPSGRPPAVLLHRRGRPEFHDITPTCFGSAAVPSRHAMAWACASR